MASGAGGRNPSDECGLDVSSCSRQRSVGTRDSGSISKTSRPSRSSRSFPSRLSMPPFPGRARLDAERLHAHFAEPVTHGRRGEFRSVSERMCPGTPRVDIT